MKHDRFRDHAPINHHQFKDLEFSGHPPADAATTELAVHNAIITIGALMREERARTQAAALPELETQDALDFSTHKRKGRPRAVSPPRGWIGKLRSFLPSPVYGLWAMTFLAVLIWPHAVLIALLAVFVMCLVGVAVFGEARLRGLGTEIEFRARRFRSRLMRSRRASEPFEDVHDPFESLDDAQRQDRVGP